MTEAFKTPAPTRGALRLKPPSGVELPAGHTTHHLLVLALVLPSYSTVQYSSVQYYQYSTTASTPLLVQYYYSTTTSTEYH